MAPKKRASLKALDPEPIDERSPLLVNGQEHDNLEAQAEQEQREHDAGTVPLAEEPSTRKLLLTMGSLWLTSFFAALDTSVVATLSGPISSSFNSGTSFSWIASGYLVANAACQPLSGKLTDIYGRRAGLIFAVTFFSAGTLICGFAQNDKMMIAGRVIAGMGGGCLNTVSVFVASDLIPLRRRGVWQGIGNIVYGAGMGLGGVYGGFINDTLGWRYAFFIQIPFIVVGGILGVFSIKIPIKETDTAKIKRVDFLGAFTLVGALVLLLIGLNSGGNTVPWNHPLVYVPLPLSLVFLLAFIYIEDRVAPEPIIPIRLLANRSVLAACLTNWFMTMSVFSLLYYGPIFFQVVRGVSATRAGTLFIPQAIGMACGSLASGFIMRWTGKYWWLNVFVQLINVTAGSLILAFFNRNVPTIPPFVFLAMGGLAYGSMLTITLIALISAVDHKYQAVITSASYAFRSTGSSIGITLASAVFQNLLKSLLWERFGDRSDAEDRIRQIRDDASSIRDLPESWRDGVIESYVSALRGVWVVVLGFAVVTAIVSLFIRQHTLYSNLGLVDARMRYNHAGVFLNHCSVADPSRLCLPHVDQLDGTSQVASAANTTIIKMQTCRLLALPAELRVRIYEYALAPTHTLHLTSSATSRRTVRPTVSPQLLVTCRQIHGEARPILYGENSVCIVVDGQAMGAPAIAESRLPQATLEQLEQVCLIFDCTALYRAHFTELDLDSLGALVRLKKVRIAMVLRTGSEDDTPSADLRDALGSLIALILQRMPASASVEFGVEAWSAEADAVERVVSMRQQSFRKEQQIVVISVDGNELQEKATEAVGMDDIKQGSKSGQVADVYAAYRRRRWR